MRIFILILSLLSLQASAAVTPCGKQGTLEERIKECNFAKGEFVLVARDEKGIEIYKDIKSGLIWSDRITSEFNHYGSQKACESDFIDTNLLAGIHWRLPTVREFEMAASHGMKESLPHMEHGFWTSTPVKAKRRRRAPPARAYLWDGLEQRTDTGDLKDAASVRCVGTLR